MPFTVDHPTEATSFEACRPGCVTRTDAFNPDLLMPKRKKTHTRRGKTHPSKAQPQTDQRRLDSRREDSQLIRHARKGDQAAFARLRQKYHDSIFNLIYRMIRDKEEVPDLTQEAFIKAFTSLESYNEEYAFSTWLYKIATNNCIDYIRRKKLRAFSLDKPIESKEGELTFEVPDSTYEPDREMIALQRTKLLEEAISSLPEKYKIVIRMRHVEEKEYQEIAKILNIPLGTVKAHIFRARELLYKYLKDRLRNY